MIPEIRKILYATDLSPNSRFAFGYAAVLSERFKAEITILHVYEALPQTAESLMSAVMGTQPWGEMQKRFETEAAAEIDRRLNVFCQEIAAGIDACQFLIARTLVRRGEPANEILKMIATEPFDLVVMGTHGYGAFVDALIGATARRVVRRSPIPVMTVRLPAST